MSKKKDKMFKRRYDWNPNEEERKKHRTREFIPYSRPGPESKVPLERTGPESKVPLERTGSESKVPLERTGSESKVPLERTGSETKVPLERKGREYTTSVAIPGSILLNCATLKLKTQLVGAIARAAAIFNVDEIIVYDEYCTGKISSGDNIVSGGVQDGAFDEKTKCVHLMAKILEYLECPQYLRKTLFPIHPDLQFAGLLNPLASTHHLTNDDLEIPNCEGVVTYREGVVTSRSKGNGSLVYVGLDAEVVVDRIIQENVRVTVELDCDELKFHRMKNDGGSYDNNRSRNDGGSYNKWNQKRKKAVNGRIVSPSEPRKRSGLYWGYSVRLASSLDDVLKRSPFGSEYDLKIGTSENGVSVDHAGPLMGLKESKHILIVFGGLKGLECVLDSDTNISLQSISHLFDHYVNVCPNQGSNTIRTEEAILVALSSFRPYLFKHMK